ncbi:MAG: hypothetical protein SYC29_14170 [Planctomycetota bacterium]|nr:hypothetical protein [Planctomycetota bacterium]
MKPAQIERARKKGRFIVEVRYGPLLHVFDRRGQLMASLQAAFPEKLVEWQVSGAEVAMREAVREWRWSVVVNHMRSALVIEDDVKCPEFEAVACRFVNVVQGVFREEFASASRVGMRSISVFQKKGASDFDELSRDVQRRFLVGYDLLGVEVKDCRVVLTHENGRAEVGPVKQEEDWVKKTFDRPQKNVPRLGYGVDIDTYVRDVELGDEKKTKNVVGAVWAARGEVEAQVVNRLFDELERSVGRVGPAP